MNTKEINAKSAELSKSAKELGKEIHSHLITIAKHVAEHKDTSVATVFLNLMHNQEKAIVRSDAIKNWLEAFAFVTWGKQKDGKEGFKLNKSAYESVTASKEETTKHFKLANANPWNKYTKAKALTSFDLEAAIKAVLKRAENAHDNPAEFKEVKIDEEKLNALKALVA